MSRAEIFRLARARGVPDTLLLSREHLIDATLRGNGGGVEQVGGEDGRGWPAVVTLESRPVAGANGADPVGRVRLVPTVAVIALNVGTLVFRWLRR